jgi:hypothetical protein
MLNWLEQLSEANQHTIAALGAISTFAAVVVSLLLASIAQRSNRTRIKARARVGVIFHPTLEGKPNPEYVMVTITNVGLMPVMIPLDFFRWIMPFKSGFWLITPWDYSLHNAWVPQRTYPAEIRPRGSETFFYPRLAFSEAQWRRSLTKSVTCAGGSALSRRSSLPKTARFSK